MVKEKSKYKGVQLRKFGGRYYYHTRIYINGVGISLGHYKLEEEAAKAYDKYVLRMGLDRKTNFSWKKFGASE